MDKAINICGAALVVLLLLALYVEDSLAERTATQLEKLHAICDKHL